MSVGSIPDQARDADGGPQDSQARQSVAMAESAGHRRQPKSREGKNVGWAVNEATGPATLSCMLGAAPERGGVSPARPVMVRPA